MAGERAGERVENEILAMLADGFRNIVIAEPGGELRQRLRYFGRHSHLPCRSGAARAGMSVAVSRGRWQSALWSYGLVAALH